MNSSQKWFTKFLLFDLRLALAVYIGFMQFFIYQPKANAQNSDPGSLQQQMVKRRIEREVDEKKGTAAKNKVTQNEMRLTLENGNQAEGTVLTVNGDSAKAPSYILISGDEFESLAKSQPAAKTGKPKTMPLRQLIQEADAIKEGLTQNFLDENSSAEYNKLIYNARKYNEYREEMQRLEGSALEQSKLLKFAGGVQYENITKENILKERASLQAKNLGAVVHEANMRFPKDTATFFILIGAVIAFELFKKGGGDPMAMQHHFDSLTDPIANLSFYSFILANGLSLHYLKIGATKRLIDMNHRLLFAHLPMISMPFASLVSNVVSDTAMTIKACADDIMNPKEAAKKKKEDDLIYSPCEEAMRQWTVENKANQYIPQLISLSLSNAPFIALGYGTQSVAKKLQVYNFLGAETKLVRVSGKLIMTGLRFMLSPVPAIADGARYH